MPDITANGLSLHYESRGSADAPTILLIMGLGVQMILWPEPLIELLLAKGFRVVRFDNRDVGLSARLPHLGVPNIALEYMKFVMRLPLKAPYLVDDMGRDAAALIDALDLKRPHVVGASMGGMIGQSLAAHFPHKIASLTSVMSTTGRRDLPQPQWRITRALLTPPAKQGDTEGAIRRMVNVLRTIGSVSHPASEAHLREVCERHILRAHYPAGGARQLMAIAASGDRSGTVRQIKVPTLVLHGDEDPLVLPAAGIDTDETIRRAGGNSRLALIKGMGHDLPQPLLPQLAEEIVAFCRQHS